ncbi:MAG: transglutaminase-like putative cysteine protease [bacterium]|jgi:transglutaminase-like putative cysteine protease
MNTTNNFQQYLEPNYFVDSDSPEIIEFTHQTIGNAKTNQEKAIRLYYQIRDQFLYDPYTYHPKHGKDQFKASATLKVDRTFCIPKAVVLAASARVLKIPSRLGFSDVKNHLSSKQLVDFLGTDVFAFHGYTELYLNEKWVKVTPTFNDSLCKKFNTASLDFDGENDSLLHPYTADKKKHMEYVKQRGIYADVPYQEIFDTTKELYPHAFEDSTDIEFSKHVFEEENPSI